ncbi:hypothetical protein PUN4_920045 [Paraburkholderia unamae]|nr:hypothetical protein PUN4_920045 [Paraburkholderia unamae]
MRAASCVPLVPGAIHLPARERVLSSSTGDRCDAAAISGYGGRLFHRGLLTRQKGLRNGRGILPRFFCPCRIKD